MVVRREAGSFSGCWWNRKGETEGEGEGEPLERNMLLWEGIGVLSVVIRAWVVVVGRWRWWWSRCRETMGKGRAWVCGRRSSRRRAIVVSTRVGRL